MCMLKQSKIYLLSVSFLSGMSIMAIEVTSARLLAPHFGTSSFIWTNVIGVVMIALSLGYYFGGKLADSQPYTHVLLRIILLAAALFLVIPWVLKPLAFAVTYILASFPATIVIFIGSLLVALILFAIPLLLLGMVSPYIIRLYSQEASGVGSAAGLIFAISTMGSIVGTFLPTLLMIPLLGSRLTISIFALILVIITLFGLVQKKLWLLFLLFLILPYTYFDKQRIKDINGLVYETESAYQYIAVEEREGGYQALVFNEGLGTQSLYHPDTVLTDNRYYDNWNLIPYLLIKKQPEILILGLAGGTISRSLHYYFPHARITGVEIDNKVIETATRFFELEQPNLNIVNQDGRIFLEHSNQKYDFIVVDVYNNELYIPWTMTTQEFWQVVHDHLEPTGVMAININASSQQSDILVTMANTIASVFTEVTVIPHGETSWNYIVLAGEQSLDFSSLSNLVDKNELTLLVPDFLKRMYYVHYSSDYDIMTDDKAPIEFMTDRMIVKHIIDSL